MTRPVRLPADPGAAAALLLLAAGLRLRGFDAIPVHADWAWFLRAAVELASGEPPRGTYAFLYTSVPVVAFAGLLRVLPLGAALAAWSLLAAAAAPLTYAALRVFARPAPAFVAALVVAVSPADIRFGRGLESPYLATTCVALGLLGAVLGAARRPWGPPLTVLGWTAAAGMHLGLSGLAVFACLLAALDLGRLEGRPRWWLLAAGTGLAALLAPAVLLALDRFRLASDLLLVMQGAVEGYAGAAAGADEFARQLRGFALTPGAGAALALLVPVAAVVARRAGPAEPGAPLRRLVPATAVAGGLYAATFLRSGYVSEDHAASVLPLLLACVVGVLASDGASRRLRAFALLPLLLWAASSASLHRRPVQPPVPDKVPWRSLELALDTAERILAAVPDAREPWVFVERGLRSQVVPGLAADPLNELARALRPGGGPAPACVLLVGERRPGIVHLPRIEAPRLDANWDVALHLDLDCRMLRERMDDLCAAVPSGLSERAFPRVGEPSFAFGRTPGSCIAPSGSTPPRSAPPG